VLAGNAAVEASGEARGLDVDRAVHAGPHRRDAGADRRRLLRACSSRRPTASATT
jgi:hypothetical protein